MDLEQIRDSLKASMNESRYKHSLGVEEVSVDLAYIHGYDVEEARITGLLHDCARNFTDEELLRSCETYHLPVSEVERQCVLLLHAKVGAAIAESKYGIKDEELLNAIKYHSTGRPDMTVLEKIIFTADYIEPNRKPLPRIDELRKAAYNDLDLAVYMILENMLDYLKDDIIDQTTVETYNYYKAMQLIQELD